MGSKREEERNEKIIRGLMKLPPNRRCINCNSLGPQYVCTNFWTFVCMTCSGIHREFTHRVKSVSMAKFTSQEVDALQKGGNQSTRSHEDETRRASSYHSYSQSPPYDFQYEERRYGNHVPSLTRKPGSDRGLYERKFSSFLSPSRFSDHANDERFANEGSYPRPSDYSVSSGGDPFRSDVLSPSSQREIGSPFSETSSYFSSENPGHHTVLHNSDANNGSNGGRIRHPQRTASSGSFGSFDSMSFKSVNSLGLQEIAFEPEQSVETSHDKASSVPSLLQSSTSTTFNGLDLFSEPFAPQNVSSTPHSQLPESSVAQSVDLFQQSPISSVATFSEQQSFASSDVVMPNNGGWATFDEPQNLVPMGTENSVPATAPTSDGNNRGNFNPFSLDQSSSIQSSARHEPSASTCTLWHDGVQNVETTTNNTPLWNAFEDYPGQQPIQNVLKDSDQAAVPHASDANKSRGFGALDNDGNVRTVDQIEPPSSSLFSHFNMVLHDFSTVPVVTQFWDMSSLQAALPNNHMPDPYVGDSNESWFPENSVASYGSGGATFDLPSGILFLLDYSLKKIFSHYPHHTESMLCSAGSLGFIVGQAPSTQISTIPAQGPVAASIGGNPFA
ncbi:hypothetical protein DH2020_039137 [Rehmannia glutinosa]|uniref:Arf-GAP domain-containing protein n=1 Tax=Rehmannia glutinosa TaxID=99300 RepID=A0ABR0UXV6_REHGL